MSIHDREWYREEEGSSLRLGSLPARWVLIGGTFVAYLLQAAFENAGVRNGVFIRDHLALSLEAFAGGEVWQAVTYGLLHGDAGHLFWNLLGLFFFASVAETALSRGGLYRLYLGGLLGGAAGHLLWSLAAGSGGVRVVGASGAVVAVLVFAALRAPRTPFLLFFVLPVPLALLAAFYVGWDLLQAVGGGGGGVAVQAHLGGAAAGALFHFRPWRRWGRPRRPAPARAAAPREKFPAMPPPDFLPEDLHAPSEGEDSRVDALLERIHADGIGSLSEEEREFLNRVSRRWRGRR